MKKMRNRRGLSLVEILIASLAAGLVAGGMVTALSQTAGQVNSTTQAATIGEDLKQSLDLVSDEAQEAAILFGPAALAGVAVAGASNLQPVVGFWKPNLCTANNESDFVFRLFYLADPPNTVNYRGPRVLYYSNPDPDGDCTPAEVGTTTAPEQPPQAPPAAMDGGAVVADYFAVQDTANLVNTFQVDITNAAATGGNAGVLYLQATTANLPGKQAQRTDDRTLTGQTRIAARN